MESQLKMLISLVFLSYGGFINYMYKVENLNINLIKFNIYKDVYDLTINNYYQYDIWHKLIEANQQIKNAETILFVICYIWVIYFIYYELLNIINKN